MEEAPVTLPGGSELGTNAEHAPLVNSTVPSGSSPIVQAPTEIWHMILEEVIRIPYIFDTGCSWQTYLYFQTSMYPFMERYAKAEEYLDTLEKVCTAWKLFAKSHRGRWKWYFNRNPPTKLYAEEFRQCIRIDLSDGTMHQGLRYLAEEYSEERSCPVKFLAGRIPSKRMESGEKQTIDWLFVSPRNLPRLEALELNLPNLQDALGIFDRVSEAFPNLLFLDIGIGQTSAPQLGVLILPFLEFLSIKYHSSAELVIWNIPTYASNFASWHTPQLRNLLFPVQENEEAAERLFRWVSSIAPKLETMDLIHDYPLTIPKAFWSWFPNLRLICAKWNDMIINDNFFPPKSHPLSAISTPLAVSEEPEFIEMLKKWQAAVESNNGVGKIPRIFAMGDTQFKGKQSIAVEQFCKEKGVVLQYLD